MDEEINVQIRVKCTGHDYGKQCEQREVVWAEAVIDGDTSVMRIRFTPTPEGWGTTADGLGCPLHKRPTPFR